MKPIRRSLHLARETIRQLTSFERGQVAGGVPSSFPQCARMRDTPITPECPSEYTTCPNSCSD